MRTVKLTKETISNILEDMLKRSPNSYGEYEKTVNEILAKVKSEGDNALFEFTKKFDKFDLNAENIKVSDAEIEEAYNWLLELNNTMEPAYVTDEVFDNMINGNKDIAVVYSGDATTILSENPDMGFFMPEEGTNIWCDAMVIPANAENPKLAHEFINYVLTYDASYDNTETVGYASTNKDVLADASETVFEGNEAYLPRSGYDLDEVFHDNAVLRQKLSDLWLRVKASK